ncbi:MAG: hypothetical protein ABI559_11475 [Chloroflexota bacterium]
MGVLKKVFGHEDEKQADATPPVAEVHEPVCPHTALAPHWDNPEDMGKGELATYTCEACGEKFSYSQAQQYLNQPPAALASVGRAPQPYDDEHSR